MLLYFCKFIALLVFFDIGIDFIRRIAYALLLPYNTHNPCIHFIAFRFSFWVYYS